MDRSMPKLLGFVVLAAPAGALAAQSGVDCNYASGSPAGTTVMGNQLYVYAGPGGSSGSATTAVGACVNVPAGTGVLEGGLVEVGTGGASSSQAPIPAVYGVIDGNNNNFGQLQGYGALSDYETGSGGCQAGGTPDGSNSGGCVGIKPANLVLPIPFIACGDTSGTDWNNTGRNGCFVP